ncbi:MAG: acyl-CoA thioesterase [Calditrichaeota bacterium]|nr:MAG: acyl-CoA thioesterase [Calditrichota bacterium]MBL1207573.1 acyl-CoA thioesterase [Calditrichota bacterium]NOG47405.1 acyl-CoA thioesterase [Calditrichota bacterium]
MIEQTVDILVRYAETDQMQFAHHSNYIVWFEHGRIQLLKKLGFPYSELEKKGYLIPVLEVKAQFLKYAVFDELLKLKTKIPKLPSAKQFFEYEVYNSENELICTGSSVHTFMNKQNKAIRPPKELLKCLRPYFN